mgnify:CR=1 FL=1
MTEVIAPADCAWDTAKAQSTVESWLSAYDLDAIVCQNDGMAVGAGNAAGANSGIVITGLDGTPDGYEAIKDGRITGTVAQDGGLMASSGVEAAVTLLDGGTLENRARFAVETVKAVKEKAGWDYPVLFRISATEFIDQGMNVEQAKAICRLVEQAGADAINCSQSGPATFYNTVPSFYVPNGAFVELANEIRKVVGIPVATVGRPLSRMVCVNSSGFVGMEA